VGLLFLYNWRNLRVRKLSTSLTFAIVAVVVAVLAVLLSFSEGIRASMKATGSPGNVIVLQNGATAESTSIITPEEAARVMQTPGVATGPDGERLVSHELCVQTSIPRRDGPGNPANVAVRGVDPAAFAVHDEVRIVEGRAFSPGAYEVIVGKAARERYRGLAIGGRIVLGRVTDKTFEIVGEFEADGGPLECEVWGPRGSIGDVYLRHFTSSAVLRLADASESPAAIAYIRGPTVRMNAKTEEEYYADLSTKTTEILVLTTILVGIMAVGAVFAVATTMYTSVDSRRREIAMLRTLGFSRRSILAAFVSESLLICLLACVVGLAASLAMSGSRQDFLSDRTWTVIAYELRMTPGIIAAAFGLAVVVGIGGAAAPAVRAARTRVIEALRKA
jgi:putative ABC transport system permease protein